VLVDCQYVLVCCVSVDWSPTLMPNSAIASKVVTREIPKIGMYNNEYVQCTYYIIYRTTVTGQV